MKKALLLLTLSAFAIAASRCMATKLSTIDAKRPIATSRLQGNVQKVDEFKKSYNVWYTLFGIVQLTGDPTITDDLTAAVTEKGAKGIANLQVTDSFPMPISLINILIPFIGVKNVEVTADVIR